MTSKNKCCNRHKYLRQKYRFEVGTGKGLVHVNTLGRRGDVTERERRK